MLNFLKRKKDSEQQSTYDPSVVSAEELVDGASSSGMDEDVYTELSLHPQWKVTEEDNYVYRFKNNQAPAMKPNQISLFVLDVMHKENELTVEAFVRSSLNKKIQLQTTNLMLMQEDGKKLGRKAFSLFELGDLPPQSSRPCMFTFQQQDLIVPLEEISSSDIKLVFEFKKTTPKHALDLEESWKQSMADEDISKLQAFSSSLKPLKPGEVNFLGIQVRQQSTGDLSVTLLIRNGSDKTMSLQNLPLQVEDANGDLIAKGTFTLQDFTIKANTSKPWTFIFPASMLKQEEFNLDSWRVSPFQYDD
ncbi:hypothetical protein N781_01795 [Pontibacillus halophilus JSM 076056 = DSM 19796]|uniref:Accessory Sec system S-layer assembly protein n=1 Tax=Pontibacillus halophilus JSM 076056 = DSM 19796 TaxID=1385510 RepID=A0A0A5GKZ4_9BACI|nr:accessory Sec system S-layer assembly protein [Pontibacillus halophilus]KGX93936.1 hypothetical protein N781_01795 [Pontibacillus halophilus JSM 076056 = DSM 19796]